MSSRHSSSGGRSRSNHPPPFAARYPGSSDDHGTDSDIDPGTDVEGSAARKSLERKQQKVLEKDGIVFLCSTKPPRSRVAKREAERGDFNAAPLKKVKRESFSDEVAKKPSQREKNWYDMYGKALDYSQKHGFASLKSGNSIYSWLNSHISKLKDYDEKKISPSTLNPEQIELVRPLVQQFVNREGSRLAAKRQGHKQVKHEFHGRAATGSFTGEGVSYLERRYKLEDSDAFHHGFVRNDQDVHNRFKRCNNSLNQALYCNLYTCGQSRREHGKNGGGPEHYATGGRWREIARKLREVSLKRCC